MHDFPANVASSMLGKLSSLEVLLEGRRKVAV
jgi:hypothetical protein